VERAIDKHTEVIGEGAEELLIFPELRCPYPAAISGHADTVHGNTVEWLKSFQLFEGEAAYRRFDATNIGRLAARFHPTASLEILELISCWYAWMFFRDDQRDETDLGQDPVRLAVMNTRFLEILGGEEPAATESPLAHALWDLSRRLRAQAPTATWMRRFIRSVREHFDSTVWEATNRSEGLVPSIKLYTRMRPVTGGMYVDTAFIEITEHAYLPPDVRQHRTLKALMEASSNVVCWANDIISLPKEVQLGEVHNLVVILHRRMGLSLQEAVERAAEMYDTQLQRFTELESQLPSFSKTVDANIETFVGVLRTRMRGNLDWSLESGRYRPASMDSRHEGLRGS
jgi:5-epi-alpha-selinene synthase